MLSLPLLVESQFQINEVLTARLLNGWQMQSHVKPIPLDDELP